MIDKNNLINIISKFNNIKIAVIGDLILDKFIRGKVTRISPEAPVPIVLTQEEETMPGGAANVASNICTLNGEAFIIGIVGNDSFADILKNHMNKINVNISGVYSLPFYRTTLKTRIIAHNQQIVRVDQEIIQLLSNEEVDKMLIFLKSIIDEIDAIIIEDYGKGVVTPYFIKEILNITRQKKIIVTVDPKEENFNYYKGVTCITPNQDEAGKASKIEITNDTRLLWAGKKLRKQLKADAILITRGENGMCLFEKDDKMTNIPTVAQEVFDVSGAGDTVISAFTLALASGATFQEAAYISNYAAGIVVGKTGVACCSQEELINRLKK